LRRLSAKAQAVARVASSVSGVLTSSTSGRTATGLKKWMPTSAPISETERLDVFVASTQSGRTCSRSSAKTCFLASSSSKIASITRSQSAKCSYPVDVLASEARKRALPSSYRPFAACSWRSDSMLSRALSSASPLMSRIATGTSSRRITSVASCAAIRPAPTIPTLRIGLGSASGLPGGFFARRSTRSNA
jgi:hypothetical protein